MYQEELEHQVDVQQTLLAGSKFSHGNALTIEITRLISNIGATCNITFWIGILFLF